jgi:hypothetical protein
MSELNYEPCGDRVIVTRLALPQPKEESVFALVDRVDLLR